MGFLSNLFGFQNSFTKNLGGDILKNPTRLLTGVDPASTKLWNSVLGRDEPAMVNWFGSPAQQYYDRAQTEGIDTDAARKFHAVADTIAGIYGGNGVAGSLGFGGLGSASGPSSVSGVFNAGNIGKVANAAANSGDQNNGNGSNNMGFLDGLFGSSGSGGSGLGGLIAGVGGALLGSSGSKASSTNTPWSSNQLQTSSTTIDPRFSAAIFGTDGSSGLLSRVIAQLNSPKSLGQTDFGRGMDQYLGGWGTDNFMRSQQVAQNLQDVQRQAPQVGWSGDASSIEAARVHAPSQNSLNLSPAFQNFIYGDSAANPYLTKLLQSGIDQSNQAFRTNLSDITDTLQHKVLPGIRGGAIASGTYGGSRQGIAEGLALSDFSKRAASAAEQLGLANISATTGAQAAEFGRGQDRALSALQGLSGQQYGVASQDAQLAQQAALSNQQNAQQNANRNLARDTANQSAILQTNQQNDARNIAGTGLSSGLLGQASNYVNQGNNLDVNRIAQVGSILGPLLNIGATSTSATTGSGTGQPFYQNTGANLLGGAAAGLGLYGQFKNLFGGGGTTGSLPNMAEAGQYSWGGY